MSYLLATTIRQIRFPDVEGAWGNYTLVINRPGFDALTQPAANTLILSRDTDPAFPDRISPFFVSDIPLSKKITTTKGRRALDDVTIQIRDTLGYTGTVNGVATSEQFDSTYQTFFDVWFNDSSQYKAWGLAVDLNGNADVPIRGYIDPAYKPSADPYIINFGTLQQIWIGTRSIKIVAQKQSITWQDALNLIRAVDCQEGVPYGGFMFAPPGASGRSNTRSNAFPSSTTDTGSWYQAVPHQHLGDGSSNPVMVGLPAAVWPVNPFVLVTDGVGAFEVSGPAFVANGDYGTINGGTTLAHYAISVVGGFPKFIITAGGSGYTLGGIYAVTPTVGLGFNVKITKLGAGAGWGPTGNNFISISTLFQKFALALDCSKYTSSFGDNTLVSALDYFCQKADNTNKNFPVDTTPIALSNLYVSLNLLAKAHPYDGSYSDNPVGFSPDTPILDALGAFCNLLLNDYNAINALDGTAALNLRRMGEYAANLPAPDYTQGTWVGIAVPSEEEPATGPLAAQVKNKGDDIVIQSPVGVQYADGALTVEVPLRVHRIGNTSGNNPVNDQECVTWDSSKKLEEQADECFKVVWYDPNTGYAPVANPNWWKGLCFLYWLDAAGAAAVYPTHWDPFPKSDGSAGSWANSFYAVNAIFKSGSVPDANLQGTVKGNDYFNTRCYHAVAIAALNLSLPVVQAYQFSGVADSSGSVQNINAGIKGTWLYEGNSQDWRGIDVGQLLRDGSTQIKFQAQRFTGGFPELTELTYDVVSGSGTSSETGGGTNTGGVSTLTQATFQPDSHIHITGAGVQALALPNCSYYCDDVATTGVSISFGAAPNTLVITNATGTEWTAGDFQIPSDTTWFCVFRNAGFSSDPLVKTGWTVFRDK
jgi:hypothetical protein